MSKVNKCGHGRRVFLSTVDAHKMYIYTNLCDSLQLLDILRNDRCMFE